MTNKTSKSKEQYPSPCIRNCCLDSRDICIGCLRSIDEIVGWGGKSDDEKQQILSRCKLREQQRHQAKTIKGI
ncbi:DUF1289 domain-containing protein [Pseudoalteromonas luteoviolacea]|uniref:DUF1289 domain-containing protein n=1 Tax=Pseudoalteromonas luteoviolacea TaxID=43657 RepID=UPI001B3A19D6|nr:DUF1289 domain-containing protein [Pseudoalteromonas luteoviolacea]MBQ4878755.1 DUF1289 domain-containing protein [Pseudoalteromonas luteoviolacea]MBQ4907837.1 DUF1289 domain-containing protein [Pseudoalteromonas luteoviolacea]